MTKETLLQELSDKIREVCPELIGCNDPLCQKGHYPMGYKSDDEIDWGGCAVCIVDGTYVPPIYPIQLQHVLRVIEYTNSDYENPNRPYRIHFDIQATWIEKQHLLITHALGNPMLNKECQYDLTLPFESQSVETLQFLHDIICK